MYLSAEASIPAPAILVVDAQNWLFKVVNLTYVACFVLLGHLGIHPRAAAAEAEPPSRADLWSRTFQAVYALCDMSFVVGPQEHKDALQNMALFEDVVNAIAEPGWEAGLGTWLHAFLRAAVVCAMDHFDQQAAASSEEPAGRGRAPFVLFATTARPYPLQGAALRDRLQTFFRCATDYAQQRTPGTIEWNSQTNLCPCCESRQHVQGSDRQEPATYT